MTRDDWRRLEPILTKALVLPASARQALIDTEPIDAVVRDEILKLLRTRDASFSRVANSARANAPVSATTTLQPQVTLASGDTIDGGRFVVVRQIGRGGMGTVYLAQDTALGTLVALKILTADDQLLREAQRAAACSGHQHVVTVHNVFRTDVRGEQVGVLVTEYVAGRPASRIVEDGPVAADRALRWIREAADAVAHAHDCGVLHCDIKPGNLIVTPDDRVKVLDFGIARVSFDPHNSSEPTRGTLPYMAPELLLTGDFSHASDVYSLGVTLFELLTGRLPYTGNDMMLRLEILAAPPPRASELVAGIPEHIDPILERVLAKSPNERFRSARAFARALEDLRSTEQVNRSQGQRGVRAGLAFLWTSASGFVGISAAVSLVLGLIACRTFDVVLRVDSPFASSVGDYFRVGVAALFPLVVLSVMTAAILGVVAGLSSFLRGHARRFREAWRQFHARTNPQTAATIVLLGGVIGWATLTLLYRDLFVALFDLYQDPGDASVTAISAAWRPHHVEYANASASLSFLLIVAGVMWLPRAARRAANPSTVQALSWTIVAVGMLVMLGPTIPRRFLFERFRVVEYAARPALEINRTGDDVLLYDPTRRVTLRVRRDAPSLVATEKTELLFAR